MVRPATIWRELTKRERGKTIMVKRGLFIGLSRASLIALIGAARAILQGEANAKGERLIWIERFWRVSWSG
jgi:hypothetical protein